MSGELHADIREIQEHIAEHIEQIEHMIRQYGLALTEITVLVRDPTQEHSYFSVTNGTPEGSRRVCQLYLEGR